jgi:ribosomal protein L40E
MIDSLPLDAFKDPDEDEQQARPTTPEPQGAWACQWCSAAIPFGAAVCPSCGGNAGRNNLPSMASPELEVLDFFGEKQGFPSLRDGPLGVALELQTGFMGGAERRERFREYFDEALRKQQLEARFGVQPSEPEPVDRLLCRWCNTKNPDAADFCVSCGTRLPPRPAGVEANAQPTRCQWCAMPIEAGVDICPNCKGAPFGDASKQVTGLTDLSAVEKAAEYAFSQDAPLRRPAYGHASAIHGITRLGRSIFGKK